MEDYRAGRREPARTSRGRAYHDAFVRRAGVRDGSGSRDATRSAFVMKRQGLVRGRADAGMGSGLGMERVITQPAQQGGRALIKTNLNSTQLDTTMKIRGFPGG